jgi:gamma-glutamylcyclotransferase (GGCT)/AIG2-like uncharacterized protein YtfP
VADMTTTEGQQMHQLFSYGTLQQERVQLSTFGRLLQGHPDGIIGYIVTAIKITDAKVVEVSGQATHPMIRATGNVRHRVPGTVFEVTEEELSQADAYEVDDYERVQAPLESGGRAWVYIERQEQEHRLRDADPNAEVK